MCKVLISYVVDSQCCVRADKLISIMYIRVLARNKMKGGGGFVEKIFMSLYPLRMDVTLLSL